MKSLKQEHLLISFWDTTKKNVSIYSRLSNDCLLIGLFIVAANYPVYTESLVPFICRKNCSHKYIMSYINGKGNLYA